MEILSINSNIEDIAEAIRGSWGKDIYKDCQFVYSGQLIYGFRTNDTTLLDKKCKVSHYDWYKLADNVYIAIIK